LQPVDGAIRSPRRRWPAASAALKPERLGGCHLCP
jgi:hypothetical protein